MFGQVCFAGHHLLLPLLTATPTVCPSKDFANILSYQSLPTSIQLWRGHGQEAKRGDAGEHRITRNVKRLGRFSSRMRPRNDPARGVVPDRCTSSGAAVDARRDPIAWVRRAERASNGGAVDVPRALSVLPRTPCITAQRVARFHAYYTCNCLPPKK